MSARSPSDERQRRREAPDGKRRGLIAGLQLFRRVAKGGDEGVIGGPEIVPGAPGRGKEERRG